MEKKVIIGLEIHLQLATESKMFCDCVNRANDEQIKTNKERIFDNNSVSFVDNLSANTAIFDKDSLLFDNNSGDMRANTAICPICSGQPGSLPALNQEALKMILKLGLALGGKIEPRFYFERKNYFYPDLPKGYQISQKKIPIVKNASFEISSKKIKIQEMHLEEDTAKIYHQENSALIDFNRAGVPLLEIVTAPEIETAREAKEFCEELQQIARCLEISGANMEKGEMRCEVNISLTRTDTDKTRTNADSQCESVLSQCESVPLGTKVEIKNLNSFRAVERSIEHEIKRQAKVLEEGGTIIQETRGWDEKNQKTVSQRIKEESEDYRYFPEPDLPVFEISDVEIEKIKESLPELPIEKRKRLIEKYGFDQAYAKILTSESEVLSFVEKIMDVLKSKITELTEGEEIDQNKKIAKKVGDWIVNKLFGLETLLGGRFFEKIKASNFADFMYLLLKGSIFSNQMAENVLKKMYQTGQTAEEILGDESMKKIDNQDEIKKAVELVLENYPEVVADYKKGKKTAIKYLLGQVMAATKGKADPEELERLLLNFLEK